MACHVNADRLTPDAKRQLFTSTREQIREGFVFDKILEQVINSLKSDDELKRLNNEARERSLKSQNETNEKQIKNEVSKLLKLHGVDVGNTTTVLVKSDTGTIVGRPTGGGGGGGGGGWSNPPDPITIVEPPTYIKIVADPAVPLKFYKGQRRYIRIETNANADYHDVNDVTKSRFNFILGPQIKIGGTTPLKGGADANYR